MRKLLFIFFLFSVGISAQNSVISLNINSVTTNETSNINTEYQFNYQIKNNTNNEISFFLLPNALIANTASSMSLYPVYKIYQNGIFEDMDGPFFEFETQNELDYSKLEDKNSEEAKNLITRIQTVQSIISKQYYKNYIDKGGKETNKNWIYQNQKILNNIVVLKPNETRNFIIKTLWDKNRFVKNDDLEYYLDENNKIELELILDLKTNLFKEYLSETDLQKINENPNFISGTFVSNKMEINFKE